MQLLLLIVPAIAFVASLALGYGIVGCFGMAFLSFLATIPVALVIGLIQGSVTVGRMKGNWATHSYT